MHPEITPDLVLDTQGKTCPGPLLEVRRAAAGLAPGAVLLLLADCPGTEPDLRAWAQQTGRELLEVVRHADGGRAFYLRNGDPWPATAVLDMRGRACPAPLVEAERRLHGLAAGSTLKLLSDCTGLPDDLATWARSTGRTLLGLLPGPAGCDVAFIRG
ncbi:MAG TPA: sulfurtransferase TusA family protein [Gammaproteobacteria bacterium]